MRLRISNTLLALALAFVVGRINAAEILTNGSFSAGLTGWSKSDSPGSDGTFAVQTGTASPLSGTTVPVPPGPPNAAMTDAQGPGTHALYQDFTVTQQVASAVLNFSLFIGNRAGAFYVPSPSTLDFGVAAFNQQARVDILLSSGSAFSLASTDLLSNVFQTNPGSTSPSGYTNYSFQIAPVWNANLNRTLRLRFAEVDNVAAFQLGVDNVSLETSAVPEPASFVTAGFGIVTGAILWRRRNRNLRRS